MTFSTRQPANDETDKDGDCLDTLTISGSVGITKNSKSVQVYPPIICGENSGQHMYLDAGRKSSSDITLSNSFDTGKTFGRKWSVKVSQIPCDSPSAPPSSDCLQYFTALQDTVKSFNFDTPTTTVEILIDIFYGRVHVKLVQLEKNTG